MTATRINFSSLQDGKSPWLMPGSQAALPGDLRGQAGIQAGSRLAGGCGHCLPRDPKGKDWGQRTRAAGSSTPGLGKALEISSAASGEWEHHSGTGISPTWPLLEVQGRPFWFPFPASSQLPWLNLLVQPWRSVPIPNSALWCYTAGEGTLTQSKP